MRVTQANLSASDEDFPCIEFKNSTAQKISESGSVPSPWETQTNYEGQETPRDSAFYGAQAKVRLWQRWASEECRKTDKAGRFFVLDWPYLEDPELAGVAVYPVTDVGKKWYTNSLSPSPMN